MLLLGKNFGQIYWICWKNTFYAENRQVGKTVNSSVQRIVVNILTRIYQTTEQPVTEYLMTGHLTTDHLLWQNQIFLKDPIHNELTLGCSRSKLIFTKCPTKVQKFLSTHFIGHSFSYLTTRWPKLKYTIFLFSAKISRPGSIFCSNVIRSWKLHQALSRDTRFLLVSIWTNQNQG